MAKFDPFLSLDCARVEGVGRNPIKFYHLATLLSGCLPFVPDEDRDQRCDTPDDLGLEAELLRDSRVQQLRYDLILKLVNSNVG